MISCPSSNEDLVLRDGQGFQHSRRSIFFLSLCQRIDASVYHRSREREVSWAGRPGDDNRLCVYRIINAVLLFWKKKRHFFSDAKSCFLAVVASAPVLYLSVAMATERAHTRHKTRPPPPSLIALFFFLYSFLDSVSLSLFCCQRDRGQKGRRRQDGAAMQMTPSSLYLIPRPHFS